MEAMAWSGPVYSERRSEESSERGTGAMSQAPEAKDASRPLESGSYPSEFKQQAETRLEGAEVRLLEHLARRDSRVRQRIIEVTVVVARRVIDLDYARSWSELSAIEKSQLLEAIRRIRDSVVRYFSRQLFVPILMRMMESESRPVVSEYLAAYEARMKSRILGRELEQAAAAVTSEVSQNHEE